MSKLFDFNSSTYYRWKKEGRPIIALLEKYFKKEDLEEFLETGKIAKLENADKYSSVIQSLSNIIYNFDYFQTNVLYSMCDKFIKNNALDSDNISTYGFKLYFTINGFSDIVNSTNYFPNKNAEKNVLDFYKSNNKKFDINEIKKMQAYFMFEDVCKLNDVLIQILINEYKTIIQIKEGEGRVLIPTS